MTTSILVPQTPKPNLTEAQLYRLSQEHDNVRDLAERIHASRMGGVGTCEQCIRMAAVRLGIEV